MSVDGYLLDTCIVRHYFDQHSNVLAWIDACPDEAGLYISAITRGEIEFGHGITHSTDQARRAEYELFVRNEFRGVFIVPITASTALWYGDLKAKLFQKFPPTRPYPECCIDQTTGLALGIDENDLWIAAQAIDRNFILVTDDKMERIREVSNKFLDVQNWTKPIN